MSNEEKKTEKRPLRIDEEKIKTLEVSESELGDTSEPAMVTPGGPGDPEAVTSQ